MFNRLLMTSFPISLSRRCAPLLLALGLASSSATLAAAASAPATEAARALQGAHLKAPRAHPLARQIKAKAKPKLKAKHSAPKIDYLGEQANFGEWKAVAEFEDEMVRKHGFEPGALQALVGQLRLVESALQLVRPAPPGKPKNWQAYRALTIEPVRIGAGVRFWNENADTLARAEARFGVPAEIIVGILGVETVYGRNTGRFRVMDVLTTLAFAYPETPNRAARMDFFRGELENTLLLARAQHVDPLSLLGSFAGAVGMPQFMPGSILAYAVDFDADGQIDLRDSAADAIGSVANFLVRHGWRRDLSGPAAYRASVAPSRAWESLIGLGLQASVSTAALRAAGVESAAPLPEGELFGLVDLQNGAEATEYWLATNNFFAITQYNRSYFYAMSVLELGRAVRLGRAM
jgi:membrane-bound lytic murein transglycosylase B